MPDKEMTNKEIVEVLQSRGVDVNPQATKAVLLKQLEESEPKEGAVEPTPSTRSLETDLVLKAIQGLASSVDGLAKRVAKIEDGGKNEFKQGAKAEDVDRANELKKNVDQRIVKIVEDTLGDDFGVEIEGYKDKPGLLLTILVPRRLSPVLGSERPIRDEATGEYKTVEVVKGGVKVKETVTEEYWPGDRRSRAIGSAQSYDVVQDHCNRVRANIVAYYEKMKMPVPEFRIK